MYCWNCGKEMEDDLLFCPHCAMKQAGMPEPRPKRRIPVLPVVCACICILALVLMLLLLPVGFSRKPSAPVDPYSVVLPDLATFLNTQYTKDDVSAYTHYVTCVLKKDPGKAGAEEFVELLQEDCYQLVLDESRSYALNKARCTDYIFHYTGKGEGIRWVNHREGYRYHAKVTVQESTVKDRLAIVFYTAPGFQLEDSGLKARAVS